MRSDRRPEATPRAESLAALAAELEDLSPGFAQRLRAAAKAIDGELPPEVARAFAAAMRALVAVEGPGREATQALVGLQIADVAALAPADLAAWSAAAEAVGRVSTRAASAFAAAAIPALVSGAGDRAEALRGAAAAVAALAGRHGGDPVAQRFAAAAGAALVRHGAEVVAAWARFCEAAAFGARRAADVAGHLPEARGLGDVHLARAIDLATALAGRDRERAALLFAHLPGELARIPRPTRDAVLDLAQLLAGAPEALADCVEVIGPVLRRMPPRVRATALALAHAVARRLPAATPRYLRSVLRVGDAVGFGPNLEAFVEKGLALGDEHPAAALAFFSLESRGARAFLRRHDVAVLLEDVDATLRGYLHLITRGRPSLVASAGGGLFPTVSLDAATVPVSGRAEVFPTWEENFTLVKLQATLAALYEEMGTRGFRVAEWLGEEAPGTAAPAAAAPSAAAPAVAPTVPAPAATAAAGAAPADGGLSEAFRHFAQPEAAAAIFAHLEAVRAMPLVARLFPGLFADLAALREHVFPGDRPRQGHGAAEAVLYLALGGAPWRVAFAPPWGASLQSLAARAAAGTATVYDSVRAMEVLCERLAAGELIPVYGIESFLEEDLMLSYVLEHDDEPRPGAATSSGGPQDRDTLVDDPSGQRSDETSPGAGVDRDLLRAYLEQRPDLTVMRAEGPIDAMGLFVAGLTGGGAPPERRDRRSGALASDSVLALARHGARSRGMFLHDEWDYVIGDYRHQWCTVHEVAVEGGDGTFFAGTLARYVDMLPEVRRQFQRVKPEGYRVIHGLLDGEDFDLNAAILARSDRRARRTPSPKLYTARQREERDVATLFLLDMSASTDEETEPAPPLPDDADPAAVAAARRRERPRRIIDIQKEALVIMAQALDEIGDLYAIYGFSGHGRDCVEFFEVKSFDEPLSQAVRARIGAIEPQRSTRMGAALRQATAKLRAVASRAKHLILLSDGFPQDFDYGDDRRSNVYGLRDTTMALREATKSGIQPFCITVDRAGHDYLREMCDASRYMVIEDIASLPQELPKIYSEATRGG